MEIRKTNVVITYEDFKNICIEHLQTNTFGDFNMYDTYQMIDMFQRWSIIYAIPHLNQIYVNLDTVTSMFVKFITCKSDSITYKYFNQNKELAGYVDANFFNSTLEDYDEVTRMHFYNLLLFSGLAYESNNKNLALPSMFLESVKIASLSFKFEKENTLREKILCEYKDILLDKTSIVSGCFKATFSCLPENFFHTFSTIFSDVMCEKTHSKNCFLINYSDDVVFVDGSYKICENYCCVVNMSHLHSLVLVPFGNNYHSVEYVTYKLRKFIDEKFSGVGNYSLNVLIDERIYGTLQLYDTFAESDRTISLENSGHILISNKKYNIKYVAPLIKELDYWYYNSKYIEKTQKVNNEHIYNFVNDVSSIDKFNKSKLLTEQISSGLSDLSNVKIKYNNVNKNIYDVILKKSNANLECIKYTHLNIFFNIITYFDNICLGLTKSPNYLWLICKTLEDSPKYYFVLFVIDPNLFTITINWNYYYEITNYINDLSHILKSTNIMTFIWENLKDQLMSVYDTEFPHVLNISNEKNKIIEWIGFVPNICADNPDIKIKLNDLIANVDNIDNIMIDLLEKKTLCLKNDMLGIVDQFTLEDFKYLHCNKNNTDVNWIAFNIKSNESDKSDESVEPKTILYDEYIDLKNVLTLQLERSNIAIDFKTFLRPVKSLNGELEQFESVDFKNFKESLINIEQACHTKNSNLKITRNDFKELIKNIDQYITKYIDEYECKHYIIDKETTILNLQK